MKFWNRSVTVFKVSATPEPPVATRNVFRTPAGPHTELGGTSRMMVSCGKSWCIKLFRDVQPSCVRGSVVGPELIAGRGEDSGVAETLKNCC